MGVAHEPGDGRRVADDAPRLVGEVHADQDVAREDGALDELALAVLDLGDLFGRHDDLEDVVLGVERGHPVLEVGLHPLLHAGVGVDDVPVADLVVEAIPELLERIGNRLVLGRSGFVGSQAPRRRRPRQRCPRPARRRRRTRRGRRVRSSPRWVRRRPLRPRHRASGAAGASIPAPASSAEASDVSSASSTFSSKP